jgi:hypothetical protein
MRAGTRIAARFRRRPRRNMSSVMEKLYHKADNRINSASGGQKSLVSQDYRRLSRSRACPD